MLCFVPRRRRPPQRICDKRRVAGVERQRPPSMRSCRRRALTPIDSHFKIATSSLQRLAGQRLAQRTETRESRKHDSSCKSPRIVRGRAHSRVWKTRGVRESRRAKIADLTLIVSDFSPTIADHSGDFLPPRPLSDGEMPPLRLGHLARSGPRTAMSQPCCNQDVKKRSPRNTRGNYVYMRSL